MHLLPTILLCPSCLKQSTGDMTTDETNETHLQWKHKTNNILLQEEVEELQHIISTALGKYEKERIRVDNDITRNVTEVRKTFHC